MGRLQLLPNPDIGCDEDISFGNQRRLSLARRRSIPDLGRSRNDYTRYSPSGFGTVPHRAVTALLPLLPLPRTRIKVAYRADAATPTFERGDGC